VPISITGKGRGAGLITNFSIFLLIPEDDDAEDDCAGAAAADADDEDACTAAAYVFRDEIWFAFRFGDII
jgi:hypothetical protein